MLHVNFNFLFPSLQFVKMIVWACILYLGLLVTGGHAEEQSEELIIEIERYIPRHKRSLSDDEIFITADYAKQNIHELSVAFGEMAFRPVFKRSALGHNANGELFKGITIDANIAKETRRIKRDVKITDIPLHISDYTTNIRFKTIHAIYDIRTRVRRSQKVDINNPQTQLNLEVGYTYAGKTVQLADVHSARKKRGNADDIINRPKIIIVHNGC